MTPRRLRARVLGAAGLGLLAAAWLGPLPRLSEGSFAAHMAIHMMVVGGAAPLLALAPVRGGGARAPAWTPVVAAGVELFAVWTWHTPALHTLARTSAAGLAAEQTSLLGASLALWTAALGAARRGGGRSAGALTGAGSLIFTGLQMVLLGASIAVAPTLLCRTPTEGPTLLGLDPLRDQQAGAAAMIVVGGAVHLAGGLALVGGARRGREARP